MKLPKKFRVKIITEYIMEQQSNGSYQGYRLDGSLTGSTFSRSQVEDYVKEGIWKVIQDLDLSLPDHFTFNREYTSQVYDMKRSGDKWQCTLNGKGWGAWYDADEIRELVATKYWTDITEVSVKEDSKEPELVFPFTFERANYNMSGVATKSSDGSVRVKWDSDGKISSFTQADCKEFIKRGLWLIKSVGTQAAQKTPGDASEEICEPLSELCNKIIEYKHCMSYNDSYFGEPEGMLKRVAYQMDRELQKKAVKPVDTVESTLEIEVEHNIDDINELTDAINNLADAYERLARVKGKVSV